MRTSSAMARHGRRAFLGWLLGAALFLTTAPATADVLIVTSDDLPQYRAPIAAFRAATEGTVREIDIEGSREVGEKLLRAAARDPEVEAVFALGGQAAFLSRQLLPDRPMVFAMVLDWQRYDFAGPTAGVAVEIPVDALFTRFKLLLPDIQRLGIIYSALASPETIEQARKAAAPLGLELVEEQVRFDDEVAGAYRRMRRDVDALWMLPDPVVVTRDNFRYLSDRASKDGVPFLAFSENFVRAGALLSIAPSYATMGSQAAVLMSRLLDGDTVELDVQAPLGSTLVINADTASALDIDLGPSAMSMADVIVDDAGAR